MIHQFKIAIYQQKFGDHMQWSTLGLGDNNQSVYAKTPIKLQRRLTQRLTKTVATLPAVELSRFVVTPGTSLRRVHLDIGLRLTTGRVRVTGQIPLICEPRFLDDERRVLVVSHPRRQNDWFFCSDEAELAQLASRFFRHAWTTLSPADLEQIKTNGKDMLRSMSFSAEVPTLLGRRSAAEKTSHKRQPEPVLSRIGSNQTQRAIEGSLPIGMPRGSVRRLLNLLLSTAQRQSVLVLGAPGCGKSTAINRWVADDLAASGFDIDRDLTKIDHVWRVSGKRIIAGMRYLGDWERRCLDLVAQCRKKRAILWFDDLHLFGRLGQTRESDRNLAEFFRGPVARGELTVIGECTDSQRQRLEDEAPSFASLLRAVRVPDTTDAETMLMLLAEARRLESQRPVRFSPFLYQSILELGAGLYPWTAFPGKALDLLRRLATGAAGDEEITSTNLVRLLSADTGLPENLLTLEDSIDPAQLRASIGSAIIGQPEAVDAACDLVARVRSGLTPAGRPLAVYLFTGPTGTGKTELAKVIARYLYGGPERLLRLDMSEYATADAPARLIGDLFSPAGQLTQRIREQPFSIVLLDEIEKAHRSVLYLLLQLFDEGRLTDAAGDTASFANAVIVMTSNLGARPTRPIGFGSEARGMMADIARAVRDFFPPELFNRIDRVVPFRPLTPEAAEAIATKEMAGLFNRRGLTERDVFAYASPAVKKRIAASAFDPRLGARTVTRYLEHEIGGLLVDEIAGGVASRMRVLRVYEADDGLAVHTESLAEAAPAPARFPLAELLDAVPNRLVPAAADALARLRKRVSAGTIDRLAREIELSEHRDELLYFLDAVKDRVEVLATELSRAAPGGAGRARRLRAIAEANHLARNIDDLGYPEAHAVWIEIARVGQVGAATSRDADALIGWLAQAYAGAFEGWFDSFAAAVGKKTRAGTTAAELATATNAGATRVCLLLSGPFALDAFAGERGCHIWQPSSAEPEIVRVDVTSVPRGKGDPSERMIAAAADVRRFEAALASGQSPLPPNPEGLVPAVRALRFRRPLRAGEIARVAIEDFRSQTVCDLNVASVTTAIEAMLSVWSGRLLTEDGAT